MSYDMMVFDPAAAPEGREAFLAWYRTETEWSETHRYDDPIVTTPALRAWFTDMIERFPAMNGPFAASAVADDAAVTDYSVGKNAVYAAFAWSVAERARAHCLALAEKHRLGFFDASGERSSLYRPKSDGSYAEDETR